MSLLSILAALFLVNDESTQQDLVDASPETNSAVDFHDRYAEVKLLSQGLVPVDIDTLYPETVPLKDLPGLVTKMAVLTRVENCFLCHASHRRKGNEGNALLDSATSLDSRQSGELPRNSGRSW